MNQLNTNGLRAILDRMPTSQLQNLLDEELQKEQSDPTAVKLLLAALESRQASEPELGTIAGEEARQKYRDQMEELFRPKPRMRWTPLLRVASVILVVGLLLVVVPQKAEAETFWEMLQRLSDSVIEYFSGEGQLVESDYVCITENEGLQQVYDAVAELAITEPVVPMWLPKESVLIDLQREKTPMMSGICATFSNGDSEVIFKLTAYKGEPAHQYYRDDDYYDSYERNGVTYVITRNNDHWTAIWTNENIECHITLDCQEETLREILKSIYVMEE